MKTRLIFGSLLLLTACTGAPDEHQTVIRLQYRQSDIQRQFDTLYRHQQTMLTDSSLAFNGLLEQAWAQCHDSSRTDSITQDVLSSMYLINSTGVYDCVTNTVFHFPGGTVCASGVFNLVPGSGIAPDHDFPITGGSGSFRNIYGTYTRHYEAADSTYYVTLGYRKQR